MNIECTCLNSRSLGVGGRFKEREKGECEKYCYAEEGMHIHNDLGKDIQVLRIQV
jgi:hypothetical protein